MINSIGDFQKKLTSVTSRAKNIRGDIQSLVVFGMDQVKQHGNLTPLAQLLLQTKPLRVIRTSTLENYIFSHITGIAWEGKGSEKSLVKVKGEALIVSDLTYDWYEQDNDGIDKPIDYLARLRNSMKAALKHGLDTEQVLSLLNELSEDEIEVNVA